MGKIQKIQFKFPSKKNIKFSICEYCFNNLSMVQKVRPKQINSVR